MAISIFPQPNISSNLLVFRLLVLIFVLINALNVELGIDFSKA
jgi:hypothetical protein